MTWLMRVLAITDDLCIGIFHSNKSNFTDDFHDNESFIYDDLPATEDIISPDADLLLEFKSYFIYYIITYDRCL